MNRSAPEDRIKELDLELPDSVPPIGNYLRAVATGNLLFLSGHLPDSAGEPIHLGKLGRDLTVHDGYEAAGQTALALMGTMKQTLGSTQPRIPNRQAAWHGQLD